MTGTRPTDRTPQEPAAAVDQTGLTVPIAVVRQGARVPAAAKPGDAGYDLYAAEAVLLAPGGGRALVGTGIAIAVPLGWGGFVLPRSGLAARHGVTVVNTPGLIDAGYRGEVMVPMLNTDPVEPFAVQVGDRIAQLVLLRVPAVSWDVVDELPPSPGGEEARGTGGFGHSGR